VKLGSSFWISMPESKEISLTDFGGEPDWYALELDFRTPNSKTKVQTYV
jgi:hypothetical protein